jgi:hypothetical protein
MIDDKAVAKLIEAEVKKSVDAQVNAALSDPQWIIELENRITKFVQDRITARFSNISTVPDLVATVESSVEKMFRDGFIPPIEHMVDNVLLEQAVDGAVEKLVTDTVESLVLNPNWLTKIQTQIGHNMSDRISKTLREQNVKGILEEVVLEHANTLPVGFDKEVTIQDGLVVVNNHLDAESISTQLLDVKSDISAHGSITIDGDLAVKGSIGLSNRSFKELAETISADAYQQLKEEFLETAGAVVFDRVQKGIDIKSINVRGEPLVNENTLSSGITKTNIEQVGTLKSLQVGTFLSADNHRVGINTVSPTSALSIWDSEISIDIGKRSQNVAQIGTSKAQSLSIVTNNQEQLTIDKDGLTWVKQLQVGRNKISHAAKRQGIKVPKEMLCLTATSHQVEHLLGYVWVHIVGRN